MTRPTSRTSSIRSSRRSSISARCRATNSPPTGRTLDAIIRRIQIVGEAAKRLSDAFRAANPQVPWRDMAAMRDRVTHGYDRVDVERVYAAVSARMPELLPELRRLRDTLPDPE